MKTWIRSCIAGRFGLYLQLLIPLLLLTGIVFGLMATTGCWGCGSNATSSPKVSKTASPGATFQCSLKAEQNTTYPGYTTKRTIGGDVTGSPAPDKATYKYTPADGASDFKWDPQHPPENPNGPPPYVWRDVPVSTKINFSFTNSELPAGTGSKPCTEVLVADHNDGSKSAVSREYRLGAQELLALSGAPLLADAEQDDELWVAGRYVDIYDITMTTKLCDDWLGLLQSDEAFLAARVPIAAPVVPTESYTIPVVFVGEQVPHLRLLEWGDPTPVMTAPAELRPERFAFANSVLPDAPGESYVALGLAPEPLACPANLDIEADGWGLLGITYLDLRSQPNNCQGCTLPTYYCYEGQELPAIDPLPQFTGSALTLARAAGLTAYQGEGITCMGPHFLTLLESPEWELSGASAGWFTPTAPISFHHYIYNWSGPPQEVLTCNLTLSSTLGSDWGLYEGDMNGPVEPLTEIALPLQVDEFSRHFWVIAEPESPQPGAHNLVLSASCQGFSDEQTVSDIFWIGDWIAPPLPDEGTRFRLYLPLMLRTSP